MNYRPDIGVSMLSAYYCVGISIYSFRRRQGREKVCVNAKKRLRAMAYEVIHLLSLHLSLSYLKICLNNKLETCPLNPYHASLLKSQKNIEYL